MKYYLLFLITFITVSSSKVLGQKVSFTGQVIDTFNNETIQYASVVAIRHSDSLLLGFTRSDVDGNFTLSIDEADQYKILVSAIGFANSTEVIQRNGRNEIQLGKVSLYTREKVLKEFVLLQRRGAIFIKGDTTEYVADSFKLDANANVEDLLKKLPGLQVDKNGQITAQGEKVKKILVDGEEFFSDDPAVVNRNLQAKTIDKVQVFEKKSESATFTGVDDGVVEKTINLQLKDKYKNGYFGKIIAGGGNDGYFENQGMVNYFKNKMKLSVFGIASNTNTSGLSYEDNTKFGSGGGGGMRVDEGSGIFFMMPDDDDDFGTFRGQGLPKTWSAGLHFSNKWRDNDHSINGNYRFNRQNVETIKNTLTQYNLPDSAYYTDQKNNGFKSTDRHNINGRYEWNIDSSNNITVKARGSKELFTTTNETFSVNKGSSGSILNESNRTNNGTGTTERSDISALWKHRFEKKGRTFMIEANINTQNQDQDYNLKSSNSFYSNNNLDSTTTVNQLKTKNQTNLKLNSEAIYTEPLSSKLFLELKYKISRENNNSQQISYNPNTSGIYTDFDSLFSSNYDYDITNHRAGATLRWVYEKINFSVGSAFSNFKLIQKDLLYGTLTTRNYNNIFPSANLRVKFNGQSNLSIRYTGSSSAPSLEQIQPLRQNTDPLNISIGNPNLNQKFDNNFTAQYNSYQVLKGTYYYAGGGGKVTSNDISRAEFISTSGIRTHQFININGNYNGYFYGGLGKRIPKYNLDLGLNSNINYAHQNSIVNSLKNTSVNTSYSLGGRLAYLLDKKVDVTYSPNITFNDNKNSINSINTNFWSMQHQLDLNIYLPKKFKIGTEIIWFKRQRTAVFDRNNDVLLWNAYLSKKFLKNDNLELQLKANDILNRNLGFSQYGTGNTVMQQSYNTIRRYLLLSVNWNFNSSNKNNTETNTDLIEINN
jgi:hypothetical protein